MEFGDRGRNYNIKQSMHAQNMIHRHCREFSVPCQLQCYHIVEQLRLEYPVHCAHIGEATC